MASKQQVTFDALSSQLDTNSFISLFSWYLAAMRPTVLQDTAVKVRADITSNMQ